MQLNGCAHCMIPRGCAKAHTGSVLKTVLWHHYCGDLISLRDNLHWPAQPPDNSINAAMDAMSLISSLKLCKHFNVALNAIQLIKYTPALLFCIMNFKISQ